MEELAVACEPCGQVRDGLRGGGELAGDLAEGGAAGEPVEGRQEQLGALEPVGGAEGLLTEVAPAVATTETLDAVGWGLAAEEAGADPVPGVRWAAVEWTALIGAERGRLGGRPCGSCQLRAASPEPSAISRAQPTVRL
jgi:hypothetical protein